MSSVVLCEMYVLLANVEKMELPRELLVQISNYLAGFQSLAVIMKLSNPLTYTFKGINQLKHNHLHCKSIKLHSLLVNSKLMKYHGKNRLNQPKGQSL